MIHNGGFSERFSMAEVQRAEAVMAENHSAAIPHILRQRRISYGDLLALLSPSAAPFLDAMAARSRQVTLERFGRNIALYAPLYVSNECVNTCTYCGFSRPNKIRRRTLNLGEIEKEAAALRATGIQNVLLLTGESPKHNPVSYLLETVKILNRYFHSMHIEIYPLEVDQYRQFLDAGVEGVTVYQETYDRETYRKVHLGGFKRDFDFRVDTPDRISRAGIRRISIGALLGLRGWRFEMAALALHLEHLNRVAWRSAISLSFPRIKEAAEYLPPAFRMSDRELLQAICAFRLFSPDTGINLSTRESPWFRDLAVGYGPTAYSAGSRTDVGGYAGNPDSTEQFHLEDLRPVSEVAAAITRRGYYPAFKDWDRLILTDPGVSAAGMPVELRESRII